MPINPDDLDQAKLYQAIYNGVRDGIMDIAKNNSDFPCADFNDNIRNGVKEAILELGCFCAREKED